MFEAVIKIKISFYETLKQSILILKTLVHGFAIFWLRLRLIPNSEKLVETRALCTKYTATKYVENPFKIALTLTRCLSGANYEHASTSRRRVAAWKNGWKRGGDVAQTERQKKEKEEKGKTWPGVKLTRRKEGRSTYPFRAPKSSRKGEEADAVAGAEIRTWGNPTDATSIPGVKLSS